jgi:hypothetical protein
MGFEREDMLFDRSSEGLEAAGSNWPRKKPTRKATPRINGDGEDGKTATNKKWKRTV